MPTRITFEQLSEALQRNKLRVSAVRITSAVCEIVEANNDFSTLEVFPFPTEFRIKEILRKLESHAYLQRVTLQAKSKAPMMARSTSLQRLLTTSPQLLTDVELDSFQFDSAAVHFQAIAQAAMQCPSLQRISLSHCKMDRSSKDDLVSLLQNHSHVSSLHVGAGNTFGDEPLSQFLARVVRHGRLLQLSFVVPAMDDHKEGLLQALDANTTLEQVHMVTDPNCSSSLLLEKRDRAKIKSQCERNKLSNRFENLVAIKDSLIHKSVKLNDSSIMMPAEEDTLLLSRAPELAVEEVMQTQQQQEEEVEEDNEVSSLESVSAELLGDEEVAIETARGELSAAANDAVMLDEGCCTDKDKLLQNETHLSKTPDTSLDHTETSFLSEGAVEEGEEASCAREKGKNMTEAAADSADKNTKSRKKRFLSKIFRGRKQKSQSATAEDQ